MFMALEESCLISNFRLSKSKRLLCTREEEEKEDIISRFPDDVLCHILSFLPMEDVVRTSLLSKRWSSVWTSVRSINLHDYKPYSYLNLHTKNKGKFVDFVDRVLRFSDMLFLQKLRIKCSQHYEVSRVRDWVIAVTSRIVEHLDLDFYPHHVIKPPSSFFTCNKLMVLKLGRGFHLDIPTPVFLPSLEILHLFGLSLFNDASMKNLLVGSPVLEDLDINSCSYVEMKTLFIRSFSLKSLRVNNHNMYHDAIGIIVDATNLKRLNLVSDMIEQCDMNSLSSLIEVKLSIYPLRETIRVDGDKIVELLRSTMSDIKCMHLSRHTMKFLDDAHLNNLPMFHNLTRLELEIDENGWEVLPYLLECSPNLLTFVLKFVSYAAQHEWHQRYRKPKCLMLYLQEIELTGFRGCTHGMELINYFLKNATILKKMRILFSYFCLKKEIVRKLLMFPRSSSACQIDFSPRTA